LDPVPVFAVEFVFNIGMDVKIVWSMIPEGGHKAQVVDERVLGLIEADEMNDVGNDEMIRTRDIVKTYERVGFPLKNLFHRVVDV